MYNPNRFLLIVLWFGLFIVSGASQAVDNIKSNSTVSTNFNLNNLYAKNKYSVMVDQWGYDAKAAQLACNDPQGKYIWSEDPNDPFPDPRPTPEDCGETVAAGNMHAQMAYGCDANKGMGPQISASVVRIRIPAKIGQIICSGTVVDRSWVVSAAHCFTNINSTTPEKFNDLLETQAAVVEGVDGTEVGVSTIYIPSNYTGRYVKGAVLNDLALLHLNSQLPSRFIPINLNPEPLTKYKENLWLAGYGHSIGLETLFHFRRGFFAARTDSIYLIINTIPVLYKGELSAWGFNTKGDSGGPALMRDTSTGKISLVGIFSTTFNVCSYPGFFADMRKTGTMYTPVASYIDLMASIMDSTVSPGDVRCISNNGGCDQHHYIQYVINQSSNGVSTYKNNNRLGSDVPSGNTPTQIASSRDPDGNLYAFVANYISNTLSRYKIGISGLLIDLHNDFQLNGKGPVDIAVHNGYVYVVEHATPPQIGVYQINGHGGGLIYKKSLFANVKPMSISIIGNYAYVPNFGDTIVRYISIYDLSAPDGGKFSYNYRLDDINGGIDGNLLQVIGGIDRDQLYLLTTKGVYLFNIQMVNGLPRLVLMANTSKDLVSVGDDARIQPITSDRVAVSSGKLGNKLFVFQKADRQLFKVQELDTPGPTGMSFVSISNISGVLRRLYVTNFYSRMMTEYTLNPADHKLEKLKEIPTGEEPSRVYSMNSTN